MPMYEPEVDDYVIWDRGEYGKDEGWVYFKGDEVDNEKRVKCWICRGFGGVWRWWSPGR